MAKKILLAEDSITMQQVVQMTFAAEDVSVITALTAEEALVRAKETNPDVVLADLSLADKDGYEICAELKRQGHRAAVILLHGSNVKLDAARVRQVRADGDLAKPFDTQTLIDLVHSVVIGESKIAVQGPIESLSAPIGSVEEAASEPGLAGRPSRPAAAAPRPAAAAPRPAAAASRPAAAAPRPAAAPPRPAAAAPRPAAAPPRPAAAPPRPAAVPMAAATQASDRPITIEAQLPPMSRPEPLQPFTGVGAGAAAKIEASWSRPAGTKLGLGPGDLAGLPPPPPGMPLPGTGEHAAVAAQPSVTSPAASTPVEPTPAAHSAASAPVAEWASAAGVDPAVYEAISRLTKDVVERIVWEVVPDLAETIIKEQLDRLVEKRAK